MQEKIVPNQIGSIAVGEYAPSEVFDAFHTWSSLPTWAIATEEIAKRATRIWVAAEWIDWKFARQTRTYRPLSSGETMRGSSAGAPRKEMTREQLRAYYGS